MLPALLALSLPALQQDTSPTPAQALETATARAEKENKRVLVDELREKVKQIDVE